MAKYRTGDIINWHTKVYGTKQYRVVQDWSDSEPKRLLITPVDSDDGKCFVATADDCELVKAGSDEDALFKRKDLTGSYGRGYNQGDKPFEGTSTSVESV